MGDAAALGGGRAIALEKFASFLISDDGASMERTVVRLLQQRGIKFATAESCTGGLIANRITNVPGASEVFTHGYVTYANEAKSGMLGVPAAEIEAHGAVSEAVARAMAEGALVASGAGVAVSVTGIAGPGGGTDDKPVGTAWIAVSMKGGTTEAFRVYHPRNRKDFKLAVSQSALEAVRRRLLT